MREEKRIIIVNPDEHRLMVTGLNSFRNALLKDCRPTDDVDDLLLKVIDAPTKRQRRRIIRGAR